MKSNRQSFAMWLESLAAFFAVAAISPAFAQDKGWEQFPDGSVAQVTEYKGVKETPIAAFNEQNRRGPRQQRVVWNNPQPRQGGEDAQTSPMRHKSFKSESLETDYGYLILLPPDYEQATDRRFPVVYWIHGAGGSEWGGLTVGRPAYELMKEAKLPPMIVVAANCPSFLRPEVGDKTEAVLIKELIPHVDSTYRTIAKREGRILSGFSMGGGATMYLGFKYPDLFCGLVGIGSAIFDSNAGRRPGMEPKPTLVEKNADRIKGRTYLRMLVGENDGLVAVNKDFQQRAKKVGLDIPLDIAPGVAHNASGVIKSLTPETVFGYFATAFAEKRTEETAPARTRPREASESFSTEREQVGARDRSHLSWWSVFGTHYRLDPDNWLGTTRDYPRPNSVGFDADVTDLKPEGIDPVIGHFSGEPRYYDFRGAVERPSRGRAAMAPPQGRRGLDADAVDSLEMRQRKGQRQALPQGRRIDYREIILQGVKSDIDLIFIAGQVNARQEQRVKFLMDKKGVYYKDLLYALYSYCNTGELADRRTEIFWEIGNEPNSSQRFSLRDISGGEHVLGSPEHARDYVEYYLAPSVEALRAAAKNAYGDPGRVKVLMGSASGILRPVNQDFLEVLLNTTIKGEHAPTLAGKKAWEVIEALVIHYSVGDRHVLQTLYDKWIATGKIREFWSTEELGTRGRGDYAVALVAMRYLDFMTENDWGTPPRGRVIFWGDERAHWDGVTQGIWAEEKLGRFLRDWPLSNAKRDVFVDNSGHVEWYAVQADGNDGEKRFAVLVKSMQTPAGGLASIAIPSGGRQLNPNQVSIQAFKLFTDQKSEEFTPAIKITEKGVIVSFDPRWEMGMNEELLLLASVKRPASGGFLEQIKTNDKNGDDKGLHGEGERNKTLERPRRRPSPGRSPTKSQHCPVICDGGSP